MRKMLQYPLKNKDSRQTNTFLTQMFQRFMKYLEHKRRCTYSSLHTRKLCTEDAANGPVLLGPGTIQRQSTVELAGARHVSAGIIPECVVQLYH